MKTEMKKLVAMCLNAEAGIFHYSKEVDAGSNLPGLIENLDNIVAGWLMKQSMPLKN